MQILIALILAVGLGVLLGAGNPSPSAAEVAKDLAIPCTLILKALRALATPLILLAVINAFMTTEIPERSGRRLSFLLLTNTLVAIIIGLLVANIIRPGRWGRFAAPTNTEAVKKTLDPWGLVESTVPDAVLKPLVDNNVIQLIVLALAFGIILRRLKAQQIAGGKNEYLAIEHGVITLFEAVIGILKWVIALVPLAVFGIVAQTVALKGFAPFKSLGIFIIAVLIALFLQACYYLTRVQFGSWVKPKRFIRGATDPLFAAFSTASSTATMPITFRALLDKIGLRESSASLGALVGSNFNNDGTALYAVSYTHLTLPTTYSV